MDRNIITIALDNSYSKITGLTPTQEKNLKTALSYNIGSQAAFYSGAMRPRQVSLLGRGGEFPTGLYQRVKKLFPEAIINDTRKKPIMKPGPMNVGFTPYDSQLEATRKAILHGRGCISMPTGTGKSLVINLITRSFGLKTLVIVPSVEIKLQLKNDLKALTNVQVENIDNPALKTLTNFDVLIIDEAHHVAAKTYRKLNKTAWKGIYYRFFLTATPFRNNPEETLLFESIAGNLIYQLTYKEAITKKYIVPIDAFYIEIPKTKNDCYSWAEVYSQLVVKNDARNLAISKLLLQLKEAGKSTLCLVKEVAHGQEISDITGIPFVNGKDEASRAYIKLFNNGTLKALIGTEGVISEGVDTKPCEFVILAALGKAKSAFMQKVGRCVRVFPGKESGKVILVKDTSHKFTKRHFKIQCEILKEEYGVIAAKLKV